MSVLLIAEERKFPSESGWPEIQQLAPRPPGNLLMSRTPQASKKSSKIPKPLRVTTAVWATCGSPAYNMFILWKNAVEKSPAPYDDLDKVRETMIGINLRWLPRVN